MAGYILLPPAAGLLMYLTCMLQIWFGVWLFEGNPSKDAARSLTAGVVLVAIFATIVGAVPGVAWLMRRGWLSLRNLLVGGSVAGIAPLAILGALAAAQPHDSAIPDRSPVHFNLWFAVVRAIALGLWFGCASALVLWVVSIRGTELDRGRRTEGPSTV